MDRERLLHDLQQKQELDPDYHDGSYELMRETAKAYAVLDDFSQCTVYDLNAIYMMAVGTWKHNVEKKKEYIYKGCLPEEEKKRVASEIDRIWDNACRFKYENEEPNRPSIGMFGTGFFTFEKKTTSECIKAFIEMFVDISKMEDTEEIFARAEKVINGRFRGMKAASCSVILHCLKPDVFPILNGNMGSDNIYKTLGIDVIKPSEIGTYIENVRRITAFRDENFQFKNYRILDTAAWSLDKYKDDLFEPTLEEYDPKITAEQFEIILKDENKINKKCLDAIYYLYKLGGIASCTQIADVYGNNSNHYNLNAITICKVVQKETNCEIYNGDIDGFSYGAILFQVRRTKNDERGSYIWRARRPLMQAIESLDLAGFFDEDDFNMNSEITFEHNMILYGPPGTGKTYNTVIYAVAIVEKKNIEVIKAEAAIDYDEVKKRYDKYKEAGQIAFTTFHQSYGYEEFIEGIKPKMDQDGEDSDLDYSVEPGVFKKFCERAMLPSDMELDLEGINDNPTVWKVSLGGTYANPIREDCLRNNRIRIGWVSYGKEITDETDFVYGGKKVLNAFINNMQIGDIVLSCYSASTIDAIGIITGENEWLEEEKEYSRSRNVKWVAKGLNENIVEINGGSTMTLSTVYRMKISVVDVMKLISSKVDNPAAEVNNNNYVFIIDEINRGNISKIFGELITLIESTKRIGAAEELRVKLPYSSKKDFGVPSNVYILGTMNTADRSISLMDTALRRRFSFVEMMPSSDVLRKIGASSISSNGQTLDVAKMLDVINERIEYLYDREHTIGHAFFTGLSKNPTIENLASIFEKSVIPLLQEYFYEDYSRIQLVLGDDGKNSSENKEFQFVRDDEIKATEIFNTVPDMDLPTKKYSIQKEAFYKIESYKLIDKKL